MCFAADCCLIWLAIFMAVWFLELVGGAPFTEALCGFGVSASVAVSE